MTEDARANRLTTRMLGVAAGAGYLLLATGLIGSWALESPTALGVAMVLVLVLTVALCADFSAFRLKGAGVDVEINRPTAKLEEAVVEADAATRGIEERAGPDAEQPEVEQPDVELRKAALDRIMEEREGDRRRAIERLMAEAAEWGWAMAHAGFKTPPEPQIDWTGGEPRIVFGIGSAERESALNRRYAQMRREASSSD